ncbi:MAG: hypothetical protein HYY96_08410 [Candidatus Tectomicrobia bacterium]|nr:hypothetical protein [Candidatus Tectomicrobia bacterium]
MRPALQGGCKADVSRYRCAACAAGNVVEAKLGGLPRRRTILAAMSMRVRNRFLG